MQLNNGHEKRRERGFFIMKTAIVTGSSSGFGLWTCLELANKGYQVLATMRNMEKASRLTEAVTDSAILERIQPFQLDVTDSVSIEKFKQHLAGMDQIDLLVNNAGFAVGGFAEELEVDDYRKQFETNVFGVMAITKAVLPYMRKKEAGKIINVSSVSGRIGFPGLSAYSSSKYALEGYTESLRLEMKPFGIDAALIEPGSYQTNIWETSMDSIDQSKNNTSPYSFYMKKMISLMDTGENDQGDPKEVARLISHLAEKDELSGLRYPIGKGAKLMIGLKKILPWKIWEKQVLQRIFK